MGVWGNLFHLVQIIEPVEKRSRLTTITIANWSNLQLYSVGHKRGNIIVFVTGYKHKNNY